MKEEAAASGDTTIRKVTDLTVPKEEVTVPKEGPTDIPTNAEDHRKAAVTAIQAEGVTDSLKEGATVARKGEAATAARRGGISVLREEGPTPEKTGTGLTMPEGTTVKTTEVLPKEGITELRQEGATGSHPKEEATAIQKGKAATAARREGISVLQEEGHIPARAESLSEQGTAVREADARQGKDSSAMQKAVHARTPEKSIRTVSMRLTSRISI